MELAADEVHEDFESFVAAEGRRLHRVLCAHFGVEHGPEVTADALAYAWEHWDRVGRMENPVGYLYRVAQSSMRRRLRWSRPPPVLLPIVPVDPQEFDPGLPDALGRLTPSQRTAVVLVHGFGWTLDETARATGVSVSTLRNHLRRGLARLRDLLGDDHA